MVPELNLNRIAGMFNAVYSALLRFGLIITFIAVALSSAQAQNAEPSYVDEAALETLFAELIESANQAAADATARKIWQIWFTPNLPKLAEMMDLVTAARQLGDIPRSIRILDDIIEAYPGYAEAWNQRATLYFQIGNFDASLSDVDEVLAREPRHFGALSGQAVMYLRRGQKDLALKSMLNALQFHPFLSERQMFEELLEPATRT